MTNLANSQNLCSYKTLQSQTSINSHFDPAKTSLKISWIENCKKKPRNRFKDDKFEEVHNDAATTHFSFSCISHEFESFFRSKNEFGMVANFELFLDLNKCIATGITYNSQSGSFCMIFTFAISNHKARLNDTNTVYCRREQTELVLILILTFAGSTIRNSWTSPLAAATRTTREIVLFNGCHSRPRIYRGYTVNGSDARVRIEPSSYQSGPMAPHFASMTEVKFESQQFHYH